jgi:hypothetical protein
LTAVSLALLAVLQAGCAGEPKRAAAVPASTTSVAVAAPPVRPPARPRPYALPAGAVRVSSSAELGAALSNGRREAIVLAPGVYDSARPFSDRDGDRLYAERLGRAILKTGMVLGANEGPPGASIRGLTFNVTNPAKTLHGSIVHVWGSATHASSRAASSRKASAATAWRSTRTRSATEHAPRSRSPTSPSRASIAR